VRPPPDASAPMMRHHPPGLHIKADESCAWAAIGPLPCRPPTRRPRLLGKSSIQVSLDSSGRLAARGMPAWFVHQPAAGKSGNGARCSPEAL
jgi:hypothetical protein